MAITKVKSGIIEDGTITNADLSSSVAVTGGQIADDAITAAKLDTTGTASADTYLSGTMAWSEISGGTSWQSVKTTDFTGVAGEGYPINTTAGAVTITLPATPSVGDTVEVVDYAGTFQTNALTITAST